MRVRIIGRINIARCSMQIDYLNSISIWLQQNQVVKINLSCFCECVTKMNKSNILTMEEMEFAVHVFSISFVFIQE